MKKTLKIVLILSIIAGLLFLLPNFVNADDPVEIPVNAGTIYAGETKNISVTTPGQAFYYTFQPDETAYYIFYSEGSVDTYGYILNSDQTVFKSDDDSGDVQNFEMTTILEKNTTYLLKARLFNLENQGEFTIKLIKRPIIDDGTISTGTTNNSIAENSWHTVTFTPNADGIYNFTAESTKSIYIDFNNRNYSGERVHREFILEKDKTYKIQYHTNDFSAGTISISINKYTAISKGTIPVDEDLVVTNNNPNDYFEYTFEITNENKYFLVADYNDELSKDFSLWVYDADDNTKAECSEGSNRLDTLKPGTYKVKLFLNGSATIKILKQRTIHISSLAIGETKTVDISQKGVRYAFTITPTKSAVYDLYTESDDYLDTYGYLMDNNDKELKYDDDSGETRNFKITYYLEKGKTYTLTAELYNCTKTGIIRIKSEENTLHSHSISTKSIEAATCTEKGYTNYICYSCGYEYKDDYVDALGHDLNVGTVIPPTCTEKGYTLHHCSRCDEDIKDTYVNALGHELDAGTVIPPTCTEKGYTSHLCSICGETVKDTYINALGHSYAISSIKKANLNEDGNIKKKCSRCNSETTEVIYHPTTFTLSKTVFTYNKKVQKPTVKVIGSNGKEIANTNYTVTYSNNSSKKVGRYTVTITFKGNYEGTKTITYRINPKGTSLKKLTKGSKQFKATWKAQKTETTGYELQYATNKAFTSGKKKVTIKKNKTTSSTVKNLKAKKKYYVRIRTYKTVNGKKYCSGWSKVLNVKTK